MKLVKMIVDPNKSLIGFIVSGKAKEFGEMGSGEYERPLSLKYLMDIKFNNKQAYFSGGNITEKGNFHINQLGMVCASNNTMTDIENTIKLTHRYVSNNENIGFGVEFGNGQDGKYKYADIIKLSEMFRPLNFVIKINNSGKQFIAGKSGSPLSDLPVINVGSNTSKSKKTKSVVKDVTPVTGIMVNEVDIIDLFNFVNSCNGFILNFAGSKYEATGDTVDTVSSKFNPLNIGEVANPYLDFNENNFNASCKFKNPGYVKIGTPTMGPVFAGTNNIVYTYVYRSKNIFYNGEHHLNKIGIIIPEENVADMYNYFGSSMAITEVTDEQVLSVVNQLINWKNSKIFEIDTSKLALISPSKYDTYILSSGDIYKETLRLAKAKISLKYVRGALKELNSFGIVTAPKNRTIAPQFAMKSQEELKELIMAGIDVYTGVFNEPGDKKPNPSVPASKASAPEVSYIIDGLDPKNYDYKKLINPDKCPDVIATMIEKVSNEEDLIQKSRLLNQMMVELNKVEAEAKRILWLHKASMWLKANKLGVHRDDASNWEINTKKRTKATCYNCKSSDATGLQLLVLNTDIVK